ncbi:Peptidase inhibitor 15, partial [Halocaridina rubra]
LTMAQRLCLLLLLVASWESAVLGQSNYCGISRQHTLCINQGLGSTCGNQVQFRGVSAQDAALILAQHNQLRSRVALGQERRGAPGPQPPASNMRLLEWDDELALVAQSHADQCIFEHECSDCRRVSRFGVGQNLFISFQSNFNERIQWGRAIKAWYEEVAEFDPGAIQPFRFSTPVGHYTQMLWWNTYKIGCGFTMFKEGGWWKKLYTCNYGPGGNIIFSEMYRRGSPCSACPAGTSCSLQYPGLCGQAEPTTFSTNQVFQQRTGTPPVFRTRLPSVAPSPAFPVFTQFEQQEAEFEPAEPQENEFEPPEVEAQEQEQEQEQEFLPMHGEQPQIRDLMPFLQRAGVNTQVIRTQSLSSVQSIINSLPFGLKPIVLFRSGTGHLTELDAGTLLPIRRFGRSTTTTRGPKKAPGVLLTCDLDVAPCDITPVGANWTISSSSSEGRFTEASLDVGEGAQIVFQKLVEAPTTEEVCVAVSHRRALGEGALANSTIPELMVGIMPLGGEVVRENVGGAPGLWEVSRISFNNIKTPFLVVMTIAPASSAATVAVDALEITDGLCCLSGIC